MIVSIESVGRMDGERGWDLIWLKLERLGRCYLETIAESPGLVSIDNVIRSIITHVQRWRIVRYGRELVGAP